MADHTDPTRALLDKLEILQKKQEQFARQIYQLHKEIDALGRVKPEERTEDRQPDTETATEEASNIAQPYSSAGSAAPPASQTYRDVDGNKYLENAGDAAQRSSNLEKFIGENLINKIGIVITIVGVSIGVKYSIDHQLISPLTRILLGYLAGLALLFTGWRLKSNYENYSAVLVSGSMAILYFITYAAYAFYALMPQMAAFGIMVIVTVFTVAVALKYAQQVIALIGLAGAYAIPFLLSNDSGNPAFLFSYMAIINTGILVIAVKKYWEPLYFVSFVLTWLIFVSWIFSSYKAENDFGLACTFLVLFFVLFYVTLLAYKVTKDARLDLRDIPLLLANTSIFYGIGCVLLGGQKGWEGSLGWFTFLNALIHGSVALALYFRKHHDKNLFYFIIGLSVVFVTIAVPVQLDGIWVTLLWSGEMVLLFWIGRTKKIPVYEILAYPNMLLTFVSLMHGWSVGYFAFENLQGTTVMLPLFNNYFLTTMLVSISFGVLQLLNSNEKYQSSLINRQDFLGFVSIVIPFLLLVTAYFAFRNEISFYWDRLHFEAVVKARGSWSAYYEDFLCNDLRYFKTMWLLNYSLLFFTVLSFLNIQRLKNSHLGLFNLLLNLLLTALFLTVGLFDLHLIGTNLARSAMLQDQHSFFNIWIRYISFGSLAMMLFACYKYVRQDFLKRDFLKGYDFVLYIAIVCVASGELIHWMNVGGSEDSSKLGLSILWGIYALLVISLGIWKKKKHLRIGAIALFAATLLKLFFYDLSSLDTISKTIVFVSLGVLLLIISFIYNKYKSIISD